MCSFPVLAAAQQVGWEKLKDLNCYRCFHYLTACMVLLSLEQKYLNFKERFEAPVRILVSSSQILFSCVVPLGVLC